MMTRGLKLRHSQQSAPKSGWETLMNRCMVVSMAKRDGLEGEVGKGDSSEWGRLLVGVRRW